MPWRLTRSIVLLLAAVALAVQPATPAAQAEMPGPAAYIVVGVAAATLRAEPNGASLALAIVPAGAVVTRAGPDVVAQGVAWRQVRTADGVIGYVPAGLLAPVGEADASAPPPIQADAAPATGTSGIGPVPTAAAPPAEPLDAASSVASDPPAQPRPAQPPPSTTPTPRPSPAPPRVTVERRDGQDVPIAHVDVESAPDGRPMGAGRIVVGFKPGAAAAARTAAHRAAGAAATERAGLADVVVARVPPGTVSQTLAAYRARPDVAWAEPDYLRRAILTPNDPQAGAQWGLYKIGAPIAWDVTTGDPATRVAILDCGIFSDLSSKLAPDGKRGHPDLRGRVVAEQNFSNALTGAADWCGHGTLMAGIAGASTDDSPAIGIAGVAFNAQLLNGKVLNDLGEGFDSWVAAGIVWAADNGAKVISMSLGGEGPCSQTLQSAVNYAWGRGAVIVAAAGNGGSDGIGDPAPEAPASCTHVVPVGAIDQSDARASFSNYGPSVPLAAPGVNVLSTNAAGSYSTVSGTSPATPHVAAVAALLWSTPYGTSNQAVVDRLLQTADPIVGTGTTWGRGRLNAAAAVGPASCSPRPPVTVTSSVAGSALAVMLTANGVGNALRYVEIGGSAGAPLNALVSFPTPAAQIQGVTTYVPTTVTPTATLQLRRDRLQEPTTLPFVAVDGCGAWRSFVGGGINAGF